MTDLDVADFDGLSMWLDEEAIAHRFSGVALAWRDGRPIFFHAAGLAHRGHRVPVVPETRFGVASVAKMVTATTALRLVDDGVLSLEQPLIEMLPPEHHIAALDSDHTLHHLLSHTSALPNYFDDEDETWASWTSCWNRIPMYHIRRPGDMLPLFDQLPPVGKVGERYRYCDTNYIMAGLAIEAATGRPFNQVASQLVLATAGMTDSGFVDLDTEPIRLATGYMTSDDPPDIWRSNIYSLTIAGMPDGGLITTAPDLARLVDGLRSGMLVAPATLTRMMTPQSPPDGAGVSYGYGLELTLQNDRVVRFGHSGSDPGVATVVTHYVDSAITNVVLCNQDRGAWAAEEQMASTVGALTSNEGRKVAQ
jgi:CubicO group peptidase (beta-lactamase class C family)